MKIGLAVLGMVLLGIFVMSFVGFAMLSFDSRKPRQTGLVDGRLRACPGTPNCVLSEEKGPNSYVEPFAFSGDPRAAWLRMKEAVSSIGGTIERSTDDYLWATFRTRFWRFVDDLELRMDPRSKVIQVRSASRVGKGDMGVNRRRVELLHRVFDADG